MSVPRACIGSSDTGTVLRKWTSTCAHATKTHAFSTQVAASRTPEEHPRHVSLISHICPRSAPSPRQTRERRSGATGGSFRVTSHQGLPRAGTHTSARGAGGQGDLRRPVAGPRLGCCLDEPGLGVVAARLLEGEGAVSARPSDQVVQLLLSAAHLGPLVWQRQGTVRQRKRRGQVCGHPGRL